MQPERQLKSKWSQYFTSTAGNGASGGVSPQVSLAANANIRARSESLSSGGARENNNNNSSGSGASNSALYGTRILSKQEDPISSTSFQPRPFAAVQRPLTSDGQTRGYNPQSTELPPVRRLGVGAQNGLSKTHELSSPRSISSVSHEPRNVISSIDTRKPSSYLSKSPLLSSNIRSRSATLPDLHVAESRPCTTCGIMLRSEEQRQFASKQGIVYCTDCYHSSYSRGHCAGCNKIVLTHGRPWVQYGDKVWHKLCIKCRSCSKLLIRPLVDLEGLPTCEPCFMRTNPRDAPRPMPQDQPPQDHTPQSIPPRSRIDPTIPSAIGGSTRPVPSVDLSSIDHSTKQAAASIPTPVISEYDNAASDYNSPELESMSGKFNAMTMDAMRIMSPVEVAEKEGLPLPRGIVDPDIGAISRSESQPSPTDIRRTPISNTHSRTASASSTAKVDAIKSMLNQSVTPIDTSVLGLYRPPLSPSLKNPNSPTTRAGSSRSVSFQIDQPPVRGSESEEDDYDYDNQEVPVPAPRPEVHTLSQQYKQAESLAAAAAENEIVEEPSKSLADYVLSKASTTKSKSRLPSVADAIKKFSGGGSINKAPGGQAAPKQTVDRSQLPEIQDLIRTHQRKPPTDPTIPALDKHSRILKSRPRNNNRRRPSQSPGAIQQDISSLAQEDQPSPQQQQTLAPNQCARCVNPIEDTWFRLSDGRQVHVECFTCQGCNKLIDDGVYVLENNVEFHPACVPPSPPVVSVSPVPSSSSASNRGPRGPREIRREETCDRCRAVLSGPRFQLTNGKQYHPECFACAGCGQRFDEGSYVCFEGQEYHHQCVEKFAAAAGSGRDGGMSASEPDVLVCGECDQTIEGVFLRHNDAAFHPNCFGCCDCQRAITPGMPFGEIENRPCCESCLEQRAANAAAAAQQQKQNAWTNNRPQQYYPAKTGY
ncbi:hypothetical protein LPJ73_003731 [Coemansia sp. RSA 2703]|nr:hypothetical protein LPJ73_003731 [Coemansia sp. RSA 2703]